jgi:hypothetical protein
MRRVTQLLFATLPGCALLSPAHMFDISHPWHAWPGMAGGGIAYFAATVALLPVAIVEAMVTEEEPFMSSKSVTRTTLASVTIATGYLVATPFFVAGLPLELVVEPSPELGEPVASRPDSAPTSTAATGGMRR